MRTQLVLSSIFAVLAQVSQADAQAAPMDMSWAIQSQIGLYNYGMQSSQAAGLQAYDMIQQYRAANDYWGPIAPLVSPDSLQRSIQGANDAMQDYNRAQETNSEIRSNAVSDWDRRAIRDCSYGYDQYGRYGYVCP